MAQANMYRVTVGDFVYFEQSPSAPYLIRKIDELTMTPNKNVEARCLCFYRRRDLPPNLLVMADRYQSFYDVDQDDQEDQQDLQQNSQNNGVIAGSPMKVGVIGGVLMAKKMEIDDHNKLHPRQIHQVKHRELYISRTVETLPATGIRGKCTVTLLNEEESLLSYLNTEDAFFYSLKYDPQQKTLNTDRGDIKVGSKYQVEFIPPVNRAEALARSSEQFETIVWNPADCHLSEEQMSQLNIVAKAVGLYARAVDVSSSVRSPSLHTAAILSSRDSVLQFSADILHRANYSLADAMKELVPAGTGPVLLRDQLEEWSPAEAALFEEGIDKYGKDFDNIRQDMLSWKSMRSMVEFYYIWKTTDRYQNRRKAKASENENKMKQVYIPAHTKPNPALITQQKGVGPDGTPLGSKTGALLCESCGTSDSAQWFAWSQSPQNQVNLNTPQNLSQTSVQQSQHKLCQACWTYWKKYGGLKQDSTRLDGAAGRPDPGHRAERVQQMQQNAVKKMVVCQVPECGKTFRNRQHMLRHLYNTHEVYVDEAGQTFPLIKTPSAFVMTTSLATMLMRRLLAHGTVQLSRVQRNPTQPIDFAKVHKEYNLIEDRVKKLEVKRLKLRRRKPHFLATGLRRLNVDLTQANPDWLQRQGEPKQPARVAFPKPEKMPWPQDQQPLNDRKGQQPPIMRKRNMETASISPVPLVAAGKLDQVGTTGTTSGGGGGGKTPVNLKQEATNLSTTTNTATNANTATPANLTSSSSSSTAVKQEAPANLTTGGAGVTQQDRAHHNGVGPTPAKQQHLSSPTHGTSSRTSNSRPPIHYPQQGTAAANLSTNNNSNNNNVNNSASSNGASGPTRIAASGGRNGSKTGDGEDFTPDDMFFVATSPIVTARKVLTPAALRKASRRPFSAIRPILPQIPTNSDEASSAVVKTAVTGEPAVATNNNGSLDVNSNNSNSSNGPNGTADLTTTANGPKIAQAAQAPDGRTAMVVD